MRLFKNIFLIHFTEEFILLSSSEYEIYQLINQEIKNVRINGEKVLEGKLFSKNNNLFITENKNGKRHLLKINLDSFEQEVIAKGTITKLQNERIFVSYLGDDKIFYLKVLDQSNKLIWEKNKNDIWIKLIYSNVIYGTNNNKEDKIVKYDLNTGNEIWSIPDILSFNTINDNQFFVTAIEGWVVFNNKLYVPLRNGKILVIDDEVGEVKEVLFSNNPNGQYGNYYHDPYRNLLVKLFKNAIHEVNLETYEIDYFELPRLNEADAKPGGGKWAQDESYIYYVSFDGTTLNALNKKTKQIDWQYSHNLTPKDIDLMNEIPVRYTKVEYHQEQLFVQDNKRNLHIFDIEELANKNLS